MIVVFLIEDDGIIYIVYIAAVSGNDFGQWLLWLGHY